MQTPQFLICRGIPVSWHRRLKLEHGGNKVRGSSVPGKGARKESRMWGKTCIGFYSWDDISQSNAFLMSTSTYMNTKTYMGFNWRNYVSQADAFPMSRLYQIYEYYNLYGFIWTTNVSQSNALSMSGLPYRLP